MRKISSMLCLLFLLITISGCANKVVYLSQATLQSPEARMSLLNKQLYSRGVRVIQGDDSVLLILPNRVFFDAHSANFTPDAYSSMDMMLELLGYYDTSVISVTGFTASGAADVQSKNIAAERANKVIQYLWAQGIDASLMYADSRSVSLLKSNKIILADCVVINFRKLG